MGVKLTSLPSLAYSFLSSESGCLAPNAAACSKVSQYVELLHSHLFERKF